MEFVLSETLDGSPTLRLMQNGQLTETMHSPKGALTETLYIYYGAMQACLERGWPLQVFSLGLGLGYNEMVYAACCLGRDSKNFHISSYEAMDELNACFRSWVLSEAPSAPLAEIHATYAKIAAMLAESLKIEAIEIRQELKRQLQNGQWKIHGPFGPETPVDRRYTCILFDAFSAKTTPELWTDEALAKTLDQLCESQCIFSTYAATGKLTRHLKERGFNNPKREGFSGKRESTFAIRQA